MLRAPPSAIAIELALLPHRVLQSPAGRSELEDGKRFRPLRVRRRVERRPTAAFVRAEHDRALRANRVEHGAHVLHSRLERREKRTAIGETGAPLVEENQPERPCKSLVELTPVRRLPEIDEVGDE